MHWPCNIQHANSDTVIEGKQSFIPIPDTSAPINAVSGKGFETRKSLKVRETKKIILVEFCTAFLFRVEAGLLKKIEFPKAPSPEWVPSARPPAPPGERKSRVNDEVPTIMRLARTGQG